MNIIVEKANLAALNSQIAFNALNQPVKDYLDTKFTHTEYLNAILEQINPTATFIDVAKSIKNPYPALNVYESEIRVVCFERLAEILDVDYDFIYDAWLY